MSGSVFGAAWCGGQKPPGRLDSSSISITTQVILRYYVFREQPVGVSAVAQSNDRFSDHKTVMFFLRWLKFTAGDVHTDFKIVSPRDTEAQDGHVLPWLENSYGDSTQDPGLPVHRQFTQI